MLRSRPEQLKLGIGGARCVDEQLAAKREGGELVGDAQALKLECGVNRHEDVVALGSQRARGRLGQVGIGLQGFVKHLHLPPFFVARRGTCRIQNRGIPEIPWCSNFGHFTEARKDAER